MKNVLSKLGRLPQKNAKKSTWNKMMDAFIFILPLHEFQAEMKKSVLARALSLAEFFQFHEESHATVVFVVSEWILIGVLRIKN